MKKVTGAIAPLDPQYVKHGNISKQLIFFDPIKGIEVALLVLGPNSKIRDHNHPEVESFVNAATSDTKTFSAGVTHGLENPTSRSQIWVSVKRKGSKTSLPPVGHPVQLGDELVERGTICKHQIFVDLANGIEVALLELGANSAIRMHAHPEAERFVNVTTSETMVFASCEPHGLTNMSARSQSWISVKNR